jgi:hypothetical protein
MPTFLNGDSGLEIRQKLNEVLEHISDEAGAGVELTFNISIDVDGNVKSSSLSGTGIRMVVLMPMDSLTLRKFQAAVVVIIFRCLVVRLQAIL